MYLVEEAYIRQYATLVKEKEAYSDFNKIQI